MLKFAVSASARNTRLTRSVTILLALVLLIALGACGSDGREVGAGAIGDAGASGRAFLARMGGIGHEARVTAAGDRVEVAPLQGWAPFALRTRAIGRSGSEHPIARVQSTSAESQELVLSREGIEERYQAGPKGLEQSYRVHDKPSGAGELVIRVEFEGLTPSESLRHKQVLELRDEQGQLVAYYRDLAVVDARGRELASRMEVDGRGVRLLIDDSGAAYPIVVDPLVAVEQAKLTSTESIQVGRAVSISGDTVLAGGNSGAFVFVRNGTTWTQQAKLISSDMTSSDLFGYRVSVSGDTAIVAASHKDNFTGAAYVFVRNGATWTQQAKLTASDSAPSAYFGACVSLDGDTAIIGAHKRDNGKGGAYVFVRNSGSWVEQARLTLPDAKTWDGFGSSVGVSGDTAIIGLQEGGVDRNAAYVFTRTAGLWSQQAVLKTTHGHDFDRFGDSVAIAGDNAIVGAWGDNGYVGAAYVFTRSGSTWTEQAKLQAQEGMPSDNFGNAVSIAGDIAAVGAWLKADSSGAAYTFFRTAAGWTQIGQMSAIAGEAYDYYGASIGISNDTVGVGAPQMKNTPWNTGAAFVFLVQGKPLGEACGAGNECTSKFCVDGVCCNNLCGGDASDCLACSKAAGAATDGTCGPVANGHECSDGNGCTTGDTCQQGMCTGTTPVVCAPSDQCHEPGVCNPGTGQCTNPNKANGTFCNDGSACTQSDTCQSGTCTAGTPVVCMASDQCHDPGTCDPGTGKCSDPAKVDGAGCDDSNPCTQTDSCVLGKCVGGNFVVCAASDQCHMAGICDPGTGKCSDPAKADGADCNDGNACSQASTCQGGMCTGSNPVVCTALDQCHEPGLCDPASGKCSNPPKPDGSDCDDSSACTKSDTCQAGTCTGSAPVVCQASDQCHEPGTCDPGTGNCSNPAKADGSDCDDGNACTKIDSCAAGKCVGGSPVTCKATDECHEPGACDPSNGKCSNPSVSDGTPCSGGVCESGSCHAVVDAGQDGQAGAGGASDSGTDTGTGAGGASDSGTGAGGKAGAGGASGSGAGGASDTGAGGDSDADGGAQELQVDQGGGCGCRTAPAERGTSRWLLVALAAALGTRIRGARKQTR